MAGPAEGPAIEGRGRDLVRPPSLDSVSGFLSRGRLSHTFLRSVSFLPAMTVPAAAERRAGSPVLPRVGCTNKANRHRHAAGRSTFPGAERAKQSQFRADPVEAHVPISTTIG